MLSVPHVRAYFGDQVLDAGFIVLPELLLRHYHELGLGEEGLVFTLHLLAALWDQQDGPRNLPAIAARMGKSLSTVRGYSHELNRAGLVVIRSRWRNGQQIGNDYDLSPLWEQLATLAGGSQHASPPCEETLKAPLRSSRIEHMCSETGLMSTNEPATGSTTTWRPEEAEAAALFAQFIAPAEARALVARFPDCVDHAAAIATEVANARVTRPGGLLIRLVERGWTPPLPRLPADPDADFARFAHCPYCRGPLGACTCGPAWTHVGG
jgi:hypothetical protein